MLAAADVASHLVHACASGYLRRQSASACRFSCVHATRGMRARVCVCQALLSDSGRVWTGKNLRVMGWGVHDLSAPVLSNQLRSAMVRRLPSLDSTLRSIPFLYHHTVIHAHSANDTVNKHVCMNVLERPLCHLSVCVSRLLYVLFFLLHSTR